MPPRGGLLFLEKGQRRKSEAAGRPKSTPTPMASSYLLGAGVSDNLGVPSVSLFSEDAVASESAQGEGWLVSGGWVFSVYFRGLYPQHFRTPRKLTPQLAHAHACTHILFWGDPQLPQLSQFASYSGFSVTHLPNMYYVPGSFTYRLWSS